MSSVPGYFFKGDLDKNFGYFVNKEVSSRSQAENAGISLVFMD